MDISKLKDKLGADFDELQAFVTDLTSQREAALRASEEGRSKFKKVADERDKLRDIRAKLFERFGIDDDADLDSLPEPKGQAEAQKQFETRIKRLERDLADATKARDEIATKYRESTTSAALEKALSQHEWIDRDVALMLAKSGVQVEDDEILFTADGKQVPLADGIKWLAQSKPHLLKSKTNGAGGSGFTGNAGSDGGGTKNPWAKGSENITQQILTEKNDPAKAQALKAEAGVK